MGGTTEVVAVGNVTHRTPIRGRRRMSWVDRTFPRLAVLPTTLLMLVVFGIPLLFSAWMSLEGWSPDQTLFGGKFAGTANYEDVLTDPEFTGSLVSTLGYRAAVVAAELVAGLSIALLLNIDLPWIGLFRTLLIVPMIITPVVAAFCWKLLHWDFDDPHPAFKFQMTEDEKRIVYRDNALGVYTFR